MIFLYNKNQYHHQHLGLISTKDHPSLHQNGPDITWIKFMCDLTHQSRDSYYENVKSHVFDLVGQDEAKLQTVEELGLLSEDLVTKMGNPLDTLATYMSQKLAYGPGERDIAIMHHNIGYTWPNGVKEIKTVDFIQYGDLNKFTAMAKTVGLPTAIAAKMVLEKEIQTTGMILPLSKDIYKPILSRLNAEGLNWTETTKIISK